MPAISMFFGIVIYMYFVDNQQHHAPHIHAKYQNDEVVVSIPDGTVLEGAIPPAKLKLVLAWIEVHREDLMADWDLAVAGQTPFKIDPLRQMMNPRVKSVTARSDYTLVLQFSNGENGVYDCAPLLDFGVFRELKNLDYFLAAHVVDGTVAWPNDQDICPDTLYLNAIRVSPNRGDS